MASTRQTRGPIKPRRRPRIAVVTPYFKEPLDMLRQAHESVLAQEVGAEHFLVADGFPRPEIDAWKAQHVILPRAHGDNGNTPRGIASMLAVAERFDFVAYLDADNWFHADHLRSLIELHASTGADVCCSLRTIHARDGTLLQGVQDPKDVYLSHVDTSCYLLEKSAFEYLNIWLTMPRILSPVCDRVFFRGLAQRRFRVAHSGLATVAFRSWYRVHYLRAGLVPPIDAKGDTGLEAFKWLSTPEGVRACVTRMGFYP